MISHPVRCDASSDRESESIPPRSQVVRDMLARWAFAAEKLWVTHPDNSEMGFFGSCFVQWGVQSNLNYVAALATLAADASCVERDLWRDRALAALRFILATHEASAANVASAAT